MDAERHEYRTPDDEQLLNFVCVRVAGRMLSGTEREVVKDLLEEPGAKAAWLKRHREFQEAAWAM